MPRYHMLHGHITSYAAAVAMVLAVMGVVAELVTLTFCDGIVTNGESAFSRVAAMWAEIPFDYIVRATRPENTTALVWSQNQLISHHALSSCRLKSASDRPLAACQHAMGCWRSALPLSPSCGPHAAMGQC